MGVYNVKCKRWPRYGEAIFENQQFKCNKVLNGLHPKYTWMIYIFIHLKSNQFRDNGPFSKLEIAKNAEKLMNVTHNGP